MNLKQQTNTDLHSRKQRYIEADYQTIYLHLSLCIIKWVEMIIVLFLAVVIPE